MVLAQLLADIGHGFGRHGRRRLVGFTPFAHDHTDRGFVCPQDLPRAWWPTKLPSPASMCRPR